MTYRCNYSDQSQQERTARRTNQTTLVRVFLCPYVVLIPILGFIPDGIIGYENFTVVSRPSLELRIITVNILLKENSLRLSFDSVDHIHL